MPGTPLKNMAFASTNPIAGATTVMNTSPTPMTNAGYGTSARFAPVRVEPVAARASNERDFLPA